MSENPRLPTEQTAMVLEVHGVVRSMNTQRGMSKWWEDKESTGFWRTCFNVAARDARTGPTWPGLDVEVYHLYEKSRPDVFSGCAPSVKAAIDGLVDARLIPDDTPDYVRTVTYHQPIKSPRGGLRLILTRREGLGKCGSSSTTTSFATRR